MSDSGQVPGTRWALMIMRIDHDDDYVVDNRDYDVIVDGDDYAHMLMTMMIFW